MTYLGQEWMPSTPMHVALYNAFKWEPPRFGHVPLLVDKLGQKLSKRNADIDLSSFRDQQGIFPATLINFASLLGWSHSQKSDVFDLGELEQLVSAIPLDLDSSANSPPSSISSSPVETQLSHLRSSGSFKKRMRNALRQMVAPNSMIWSTEYARLLRRIMSTRTCEFCLFYKGIMQRLKLIFSYSERILRGRTLSDYIAPLIRADAKSFTTAEEFAERNSTFFATKLDRPTYNPVSSSSTSKPTVPMLALHTAAAALTLVPAAHWNIEMHRSNITSYDGSDSVEIAPEVDPSSVATDKIFKKELYHYLRWALSASAPGPGMPETMTILGRDETVRRLQDAKTLTQSLVPQVGRRVPKSSGQKKLEEDRSWMGSLAPEK